MDDILSWLGSISGYCDGLFLLPLLPGQPWNLIGAKKGTCKLHGCDFPRCFPGSWVSTYVLHAAGCPCFQPRLRAMPRGMASLFSNSLSSQGPQTSLWGLEGGVQGRLQFAPLPLTL